MNTIETGPPDMAMPAIPKCGPGPGRTSGSIAAAPHNCHVTFDHPPINAITSTAVAEAQ